MNDRRLLELVPGWKGKNAVLTPLSGGITNRNLRVDIGKDSFVLRKGGKGAGLLGINRKNEHQISAIAARLGIGAPIIYSLPHRNLQVTRFILGKTMSPRSAASPRMLKRIVQSIKRVHNGPKFPGVFSPFETVRAYHRLAAKHKVSFPPILKKALALMDQIEEAVGPATRLRPCHNDLLAGNLIDDGRRVRIIDWEYAAMGDPFFDLGNFAVNQQLNKARCRLLLTEYFGVFRSEDLRRLNFFRLASFLRESFWGFLQGGISKIDFDFRDYALVHLNRYLRDSKELTW